MSLKPGLGQKWFEKYHGDVFPADELVHEGRRHRVPRFYDNQLDEESRALIKAKRAEVAALFEADNTDARLGVREGVAQARLRAFRRKL